MIEFVANRYIYCGNGSIQKLPELLNWYQVKKVFLAVYSKDAPITAMIQGILHEAGLDSIVYSGVTSEPDLEMVDHAAALCRDSGCDGVIALGGGSVIDVCKTVAMIAVNGGRAVEYQLEGKEVVLPPLPFIAIPTTAGTGAEATKVSVLYNKEKGFKKSVYHTSMIAQAVLLDPQTILGMPKHIIAATGMDAITHAIESYVSVFATPVSRMYSLKALELLYGNIVAAYEDPNDAIAHENMLLGSYLAGCAISAGTCLAHIVGQPVGAIFKIPHGNACSIYLAPSIRLNKDYALDLYLDVARVMGLEVRGRDPQIVVEEVADQLDDLCCKVEMKNHLTDYVPIEKINIEEILDNIQTSMGHIKTNPNPVSRELFEKLIRAAL